MQPEVQTACSEGIRRALRQGAQSLAAAAAQSVQAFILSQLNPDGGFRGRSSKSDLYYTVFALECAEAFGLELPRPAIRNFLEQQAPAVADFVHLTCLARGLEMLWPQDRTLTRHAGESQGDGAPDWNRACLPAEKPNAPDWNRALREPLGEAPRPEPATGFPGWAESVLSRLTAHSCPEGGYHAQPNKPRGTVYESFLGMLACEAFGQPFPLPEQMGQRLTELQRNSGGFVNDGGFGTPTTPVTAAAAGLCWELKTPPPSKSLEWLVARGTKHGGFKAAALVPLPDLLSTATALHALRTHGWLDSVERAACQEFVTSLWNEDGGFCGHAFDTKSDCEYTFYGLLALGNLAMG